MLEEGQLLICRTNIAEKYWYVNSQEHETEKTLPFISYELLFNFIQYTYLHNINAHINQMYQ